MPFTVRGRDLVIVHMALHFMSTFPSVYMDKDRMWELRWLSGAAYSALQNEQKKEARAWEKKNLLPKGSIILAPRKIKKNSIKSRKT